jgi:hypothetical protein
MSKVSKKYTVNVVYAQPGSCAERVLRLKSGRSGPSAFAGLVGQTLKVKVTIHYTEFGTALEDGFAFDRDTLDDAVLEEVFSEDKPLNSLPLFKETPVTLDTMALTAQYALCQRLNLTSSDVEISVTGSDGETSYA